MRICLVHFMHACQWGGSCHCIQVLVNNSADETTYIKNKENKPGEKELCYVGTLFSDIKLNILTNNWKVMQTLMALRSG